MPLRLPNCINCAFYNKSIASCRRVFMKHTPKIQTFYYPKVNIARSHDYLCGAEGRNFIDIKLVKQSNASHIIG